MRLGQVPIDPERRLVVAPRFLRLALAMQQVREIDVPCHLPRMEPRRLRVAELCGAPPPAAVQKRAEIVERARMSRHKPQQRKISRLRVRDASPRIKHERALEAEIGPPGRRDHPQLIAGQALGKVN